MTGNRRLALVMMALLVFPVLAPGAAAGGEEQNSSSNVKTDMEGRAAPPDVNPHLYHAECAARWLISIAVEPAPGQYKWYASDVSNTKYCLELSEGASGIGAFFTMLYEATQNATYLKYAEGAARWIISKAEPTAPDACRWTWYEGFSLYQADKFGGVGAIGEFLLRLYKATSNATYLDYSEKAAGWIMDTATPQYGGYKWELVPGGKFNFTGWAHGVAGICDFLRMLGVATSNATYLDFAQGGARWLIAIANTTVPGQCSWVRLETDNSSDLSWCGGTTGIVQFFILMWRTFGNATYLDYAKGGGNWMISQATTVGPGVSYFHYLNIFCHGDPSDSYVLFMLYNATGNATYLRYAEESANWTLSTGISVGTDMMKWPSIVGMDYNETGITRGACGIGVQMLMGFNITGNRRYLDYAKKAANWVENISIEEAPGVEKWNWEERQAADKEYFTGWYYGAAGIGMFLLDMVPFWTPPVKRGVDILNFNLTQYTDPGEPANFELLLMNTGNVVDSISLELTPPGGGWLVTTEMNGTDISPVGTRQAFVNVTPPADALASARLVVILTARSNGDGNVTDNLTITTIVNAVYRVNISKTGLEKSVNPGETVIYNLSVQCTANAYDTVTLACTMSPPGWAINISYNGSDLAPGESREALVTITAPADALAGANWTAGIKAISTGNLNISDSTTLLTTVNLFKGVRILERNVSGQAKPGEAVTYNLTIRNSGNSNDDIGLNISDTAMGLSVAPKFNGSGMAPSETRSLELMVTSPMKALAGRNETVTVRVYSNSNASVYDKIVVSTKVLPVPGVEIPSPQNKSTLPGQTVQFVFNVLNHGNLNETFALTLECTPAWQAKLLGAGGPITIGPFQDTNITVEATTPSDALAGSAATIVLKAISTLDPKVNASARATLTVLPMVKFRLTADTANVKVLAGNRSTLVNLTLNNTGNIECTIAFEVRGNQRQWVDPNQWNISVAMNAAKLVTLSITPPNGTKGSYVFDIVATAGNYTQSVSLNVNVEPRPIKEPPVTVSNNNMLYAAIGVTLVAVAVAAAFILFRKGRKPDRPRDEETRPSNEPDGPG